MFWYIHVLSIGRASLLQALWAFGRASPSINHNKNFMHVLVHTFTWILMKWILWNGWYFQLLVFELQSEDGHIVFASLKDATASNQLGINGLFAEKLKLKDKQQVWLIISIIEKKLYFRFFVHLTTSQLSDVWFTHWQLSSPYK